MSEKRREGRPLKFETVEELRTAIEDYFKSCYEEQWVDEPQRDEITGEWLRDDKGKKIYKPVKKPVQVKHFTITGLALFLNTSRETLMNYEKKDEFFDTILQGKQIIEKAYEERLINRGNGGDIFALKNFKWKDESTVNANTNSEEISDIKKALEDLKQQANEDFGDSQQPEEAGEDDKTEASETNTETA